jgi:hypothetical protein
MENFESINNTTAFSLNTYSPIDTSPEVKNNYQKEKELKNKIFFLKQELIDTEWTLLPDSPLTQEKQSEWLEYRNQLKDILNSNNINAVWPTKPA